MPSAKMIAVSAVIALAAVYLYNRFGPAAGIASLGKK